MKNILFIGGAGFIGSNLIKTMLIECPDNNIYVIEPSFSNIDRLKGLNIRLFHCELRDLETIKTIIYDFHINVIVHLVSTLIPGSGFEEYRNEIQKVVFPTFNLSEFCSEKEIMFVFFSSGGAIYGNRTSAKPFKESDKRNPISFYGLTKLIIENNILFHHRTKGLKYIILRPSNPFGTGQSLYGNQGLIAVAIGKILRGNPIEIWGDGKNIRDYIYINDLSKIFCGIINKNIKNKILNIGSGVGYSIIDVIDILQEVAGKKLDVVFKPNRMIDVSHMILSTTKLRKIINYTPVSLREGISLFYNSESKKNDNIC